MKQRVDNFDLIYPLLEWKKEGDYFYVQLFLRKKDLTTSFGNKNNSARLIKSYCFFNLEQFKSKREEITKLCEFFKCRAGINLNIRNEEEVGFELLINIAERLKSKNYKGINGVLNTTNGSLKSKDKFWLIDCDSSEEFLAVEDILQDVTIKPEGDKIIEVIPTYSGKHIITKGFDRNHFDQLLLKKYNLTVEIHKNNPTALYYSQQE